MDLRYIDTEGLVLRQPVLVVRVGHRDHLGIFRSAIANLTGGDQPERISVAFASSAVFETMGALPLLGRTLTAAEDKPGTPISRRRSSTHG